MVSTSLNADKPPRVAFADRLAGTAVLIVIAAALVSARTLAGTVFLPMAVVVIGVLLAGRGRDLLSTLQASMTMWLPWAVFFAYATTSALWADTPSTPLIKGGSALLIFMATALTMLAMYQLTQRQSFHLAEAVWMGLAIGLAYFTIEILSDQAVKVWVYNLLDVPRNSLRPPAWYRWDEAGELLSVNVVDLTRNAAPITLLLWLAIPCTFATLSSRSATMVSALLVATAGFVVFSSPHEASMLAFVTGAIALGLGLLSSVFLRRLLAIVWVAACLLVVPAVMTLHDNEFHKVEAFQRYQSFVGRLLIWNLTAEQTFNNPVVGIGARMTHEVGPKFEAANGLEPGSKRGWLSRHAHNVFLQTWFELG
ncbi:MAG: O-antigen ligase family protein, partial [Pseudomonadota bacterium]